MTFASDITIRSDLQPGDLGRILTLHGTAYAKDDVHFGVEFEGLVAESIAEFVLGNQCRGRVFLAERGGALVACAAIVERKTGDGVHGQLRWIVADPSVRGTGLGRRLIDLAMDHARASGWSEAFLLTTGGLDASMAIYEKLGFQIEKREPGDASIAGGDVITMRLKLK